MPERNGRPHDGKLSSPAAERSVLGSVLRDGWLIRDVQKIISPYGFATDKHVKIFKAMCSLAAKEIPIDVVTVAEELTRRDWLDDTGRTPYLIELQELVTTGANAIYHAEIVRDSGKRREAFRLGNQLIHDACNGRPIDDTLTQLRVDVETLGTAKTDSGFKWEPIDSATLAAGSARPKMLIHRLLVEGQPAIGGGAQKTLKTRISIDAGISLGTGTAFLNEFAVPRQKRVSFLSGESGRYAIELAAKEVCQGRGIDLASAWVKWQFKLPRVSLPAELDELRRGLERDKTEVVFLDPLYLSLLSGSVDVHASNLFEMGPLLQKIASACLDVGATPILMHHASRPATRKYEPLELSDLSFAGIPEFARQWWLVSRREPYVPGTGEHRLYLRAEGSIGHSGLWHLDIDEGRRSDDFQSGGKWNVAVESAGQTRETKTDDRKAKRQRERAEQDQAVESAVMAAIDSITAEPETEGWASRTRIRNAVSFHRDPADKAIERLRQRKLLDYRTGKSSGGPADFFRRKVQE